MFRVDYERIQDNPGFCRILVWQQDETKSIVERNPKKDVYEENVPEEDVMRRVTDISNKLNKRS